MIKSIRHIGLVVNDLDRAVSFWREVMGFSISKKMSESGLHIDSMMGLADVNVTTVKLAPPGGTTLLELLKFNSHPDKPNWGGAPYSTGLTHIALQVENIDILFERLTESGVSFPARPQLSKDGSAKVIYASGPENVLLELVEVIS